MPTRFNGFGRGGKLLATIPADRGRTGFRAAQTAQDECAEGVGAGAWVGGWEIYGGGGNGDALKFSFPGSAWERTARQALPVLTANR